MRTTLWVVLAVCLVAGLVGIWVVSGGNGTDVTTESPEAASPAAMESAEAGNPGVFVAPKAGEYNYIFKNDTGDGGSARSTYGVPKRSGDITTQTLQVVGGGRNERSKIEWRADGQYFMTTAYTQSGTTLDCTWSPPLLERRLPMSPGVTWASESSCPVNVNGAPGEIRRKVTGSVTETQRIKVDDKTVDVWVYDWTDLLQTPRGVQEQSGKVYFSPAHGLFLRSTGVMKQTEHGGETVTRNFERELSHLKPAT